MILYNITFCVDEPQAEVLVRFIRTTLIPRSHNAGMRHALLTQIRAPKEVNATTGQPTTNYALQMRAPSEEVCSNFAEKVLPEAFSSMASDLASAIAVYATVLDTVYDHDKDGKSR